MFDLDFSFFAKLPPIIQGAVAIAIAAAAGYAVFLGLRSKFRFGENAHPIAAEAADLAVELADAKVQLKLAEMRSDFIEVVHQTRVALEMRIDTIATEFRASIEGRDESAKADRHMIYNRIQELAQGFDADFSRLDQRIRMLEQRRR